MTESTLSVGDLVCLPGDPDPWVIDHVYEGLGRAHISRGGLGTIVPLAELTHPATAGRCECGEPIEPGCPACDTCYQRTVGEVIAELHATDPRFREEMDRWHHVDSPEGQAILAQFDGSTTTRRTP